MKINGATVLVTGANRGLGRALATAFLDAGATVYAGARDPNKVDIAGAKPVQLDITDPASISALAAKLGDVDIVVNNAGVFVPAPTSSPGAADALRTNFATNVYGTYDVATAFAPILAKNGGGTIVNVLSVLSWVTLENTSGYSASKAAAWALTNGLRKELKAQGTRVVAVHVGYMDTDMAASITMPKTKPSDVAAQILDAILQDEPEVLADGTSRNVKASLGTSTPAYL
ncbi:MAG TPA: SDR family oxidoreductase [Rhodanobacteraceae bacterium]|nr:SDR family oxidoreductase [Rhodanobacteraceae bacterium]